MHFDLLLFLALYKSFGCLLNFLFFLTYFYLTYLLPYLSTFIRIGSFHFQVEVVTGDQTFFYLLCLCYSVLVFLMNGCFCYIRFLQY